MSELSEEEITRVVRQAMLSNPDGGPFRHRETERSLIASEAARLVLALLQPALERARVEESALKADNEKLRYIVGRYLRETPLGHQPHMLAHLAEKAMEGPCKWADPDDFAIRKT